MTISAKDLQPSQIFTDHMNHTYTATRVDPTAGGTGAGVYVNVVGQNYPEFYLSDQAVTLV